MFKETLESLMDNMKERTTNPFLGTFICVWLIHNSKLIYSLIYFDDTLNLESRLAYLSGYFDEKPFIWNLVLVILIALFVLVVTYILLAFARYITEYYEKVIVPKIAEATDKSSIVLKSDFNEMKEALRLMGQRLEEERLAKATAQRERDQSDEKLSKLISEKNILNSTPVEDIRENSNIPSSFTRVAYKAKHIWKSNKFNNYLSNIKSGALVSSQEDIVKVLLLENFITPTSRSSNSGKEYKLTDEGLAFLKYWNDLAEEDQ